ncbi:MAG TPA: hypothetical protein P5539_16270 [Mesotoga sp.]|nr:hypothetical protein [Mesotoga sp.]
MAAKKREIFIESKVVDSRYSVSPVQANSDPKARASAVTVAGFFRDGVEQELSKGMADKVVQQAAKKK